MFPTPHPPAPSRPGVGASAEVPIGPLGGVKGEIGVRNELTGFSLWVLVQGETPLRQRGPEGGVLCPLPLPHPPSGPLKMTFLERNVLVIS